ncbi:FG-GAP repeat domain-containing protein [Hymenobacter cellulosilyticus]|uniref:VCBS repeat-containing protein n=1 Tax=Hymenobacter cellulosilyticus TaxID=2932248 RepID=A0A8T9Q811_9BACT|nr:VCBS repeat-containing protein [Hymenobacter cellulosilyticus]UOQ73706.1 VCBS repeat-containing protein [Hymenobacter cellulosilyticus]
MGNGPFNVTTGDVNNDGPLDLVTANLGGSDVSIRLNNGQGTFGGTISVRVGGIPFWVLLGDVDGDRDLDILTANYGTGTVSIRPNDGRGVFGAGSDLPVGIQPRHLALTDVDGDGDLDILAVGDGANPGLRMLRNNGAGTFAAAEVVVTGSAPWFVAPPTWRATVTRMRW